MLKKSKPFIRKRGDRHVIDVKAMKDGKRVSVLLCSLPKKEVELWAIVKLLSPKNYALWESQLSKKVKRNVDKKFAEPLLRELS